MKKLLLGTSAIALAGAIATPASAAEWNVRVGGYNEQQIAYATSDNDNIPGDFDGVDVKSDSEIHFSPVITLDNGIKVGARIELEGTGSGSDQVDENYVYFTGSFGRLAIGEDDNAAYIMGYGAPDVTFVNINSGSDSLWLPFSAAFGTTTTFISVEFDSVGIRYFSPRMAGFQVGVSYARDAFKDSDDAQKDEDAPGSLNDIIGIGANYVNSFGDFNIAVSGGYTTGSLTSVPATPAVGGHFVDGVHSGTSSSLHSYNCGDVLPVNAIVVEDCVAATSGSSGKDPEAWSAGLNLGFGGFTVGGSYAEWNNQRDGFVTYDLGVSYATGPWGVSFTYVRGELDTDGGEIDKFLLGLDYKLATGVRLSAFAIYEEADSNSGTQDYDGDGFILGTGVKVNF